METTKIIYGLYDDDDLLLQGIEHLKSDGIKIKEVYTPFPVHGLDHVLGLKKTRLSDLAFVYGCYGLSLAVFMMYYIMIYDWPQDIGGKPSADPDGMLSLAWFRSMPAFVPIMFELTVFCTAHLMVLTFLFRNKLFPGAKPQNPDARTTDDKFMVELEVKTQALDQVTESLKKSGVIEITMSNA